MSQQLAELESERLQSMLAALDRIKAAGARPDDVALLAKELGVSQWMNTRHGLPTTTERNEI